MDYEIVFLGLLLTLLYIRITGYFPGGLIVPSYLVLFCEQPERIIGTIFVAIGALLSYKIVSRYLILFGRRRFLYFIMAGGVGTFLWLQCFPLLYPFSGDFRVIGWIIPGLIANNCERQGIVTTTASLIIVLALSYFLWRLYYILI